MMIGLRTFISYLVFLGTTAGLLAFGHLQNDSYEYLNYWALWIFFGSNVAKALGPGIANLSAWMRPQK